RLFQLGQRHPLLGGVDFLVTDAQIDRRNAIAVEDVGVAPAAAGQNARLAAHAFDGFRRLPHHFIRFTVLEGRIHLLDTDVRPGIRTTLSDSPCLKAGYIFSTRMSARAPASSAASRKARTIFSTWRSNFSSSRLRAS